MVFGPSQLGNNLEVSRRMVAYLKEAWKHHYF